MAATFQYLPSLVPNIFADIVAQASNNLKTDARFTIPQISFKHGNWDDIKNELIKQGNSYDDIVKSTKYPLVCLIHSFNESYVASEGEFTGDLLIVAPCKPDEHIPYKYSANGNFQKYLNPIYAELVALIRASDKFSGYTSKVEFPKRDLIHFNSVAENNQYILPDLLDGILIPNLNLRLSKPKCSNAYGTNCIKSHNVNYINSINFMEITVNGNLLSVFFTVQGFVETPLYEIDIAGLIVQEVFPNVANVINIQSVLNLNESGVIVLSGRDESIEIPLVIEDREVILAPYQVYANFEVNTDCGNYMPLTMYARGVYLTNQFRSIQVTLNGDIIYARTTQLSVNEIVADSNNFYTQPILIPTPFTSTSDFTIVTTYTTAENLTITHTAVIQLITI